MVVDTSALLAVLQREPGHDQLLRALHAAPGRHVSAATLVEAGLVVLARFGDAGDALLDALVRELDLTVVPVSVEQARLARDAAARFGKGRHPAGLNFGDCFSYALAVAHDEPLLCTGDDFRQTDVRRAMT